MHEKSDHRYRGFSLVEMLVVVIIIIVLSAVGVPGLIQYYRGATINGAIRSVATEIEKARYSAIGKNVNIGVVFTVLSDHEYRYVVEDDQDRTTVPNWSTLAGADWNLLTTGVLAQAQAGGVRTLPTTVQFVVCGSQTGGGGGATEIGFRFDRLGRPRSFTNSNGPTPNLPVVTPYITMDAQGATICVQELATGRTAWLTVMSGGRVRIQRASGA
ncbi:MAG: prepilin-type N-terminal cleavage/methylation domain-containing protein [Vicinamibacteria bacterium]|nr:prepilin-type N-terminal cleavage/methylation domain-containing protein [Vicinamibacteria bacterium]